MEDSAVPRSHFGRGAGRVLGLALVEKFQKLNKVLRRRVRLRELPLAETLSTSVILSERRRQSRLGGHTTPMLMHVKSVLRKHHVVAPLLPKRRCQPHIEFVRLPLRRAGLGVVPQRVSRLDPFDQRAKCFIQV